MTNLKRLGAAVVLTCVLGLSVLADCPLPAPGQTEGPPCVPASQTAPDDPTAPGIMNGPPAASASAEVELVSFAKIALNALMLF